MSKVLKVKKPFFIMEPNDTFELSEDEKEYVNSFNLERHESDDESCTALYKYNSSYSISPEYAEFLIKGGYLEQVATNEQASTFVNIFDEIDKMLASYKKDIGDIDEEMADKPACLKIEKQTVLQNLITTLEYLKSLKR